MMDAGDQGGAALIAVDQVNLPQGLVKKERRAVQGGSELLQFELTSVAGQGDAMDVVVDIEVGDVLPVVASVLEDRFLAEAVEFEESFFEKAFEAADIHRVVKN